MLIDFKVKNFLSFDNEQVLSMEAGKVRAHSERIYNNDKSKLLKFMAIYGANASGKSNLISAMNFAKNVIISGLSSDVSDYYCKLSDENSEKTTQFQFTLELNGKKYRYGFSAILKKLAFTAEWLIEVSDSKKEKIIFRRDISDGKIELASYFKDKSINERLSIYADDIKSDETILFLTLMNRNKSSFYETFEEARAFKKIFNWFSYSFSVNSPNQPITNYSYLMNNDIVDKISDILRQFSTGITTFNFVELSIEKVFSKIPKELCDEISNSLNEQLKYSKERKKKCNPAIMLRSNDNSMYIIRFNENGEMIAQTFQFNHSNTNSKFSLNEESDGTVRLLDLIEIFLTDSKEKVYVIDEINRYFHPLLTYRLVEKYLELAADNYIQLIVTTHESYIMDFSLLRKDEICFVNKDDNGRSEIYSLEKFGERFDKKICLAYLKGSYDAIPKFDDNSHNYETVSNGDV